MKENKVKAWPSCASFNIISCHGLGYKHMKYNWKTNPSQRIRQEINKDIEVNKNKITVSTKGNQVQRERERRWSSIFISSFYVFMVTTLLRSQAVQRNKKKTRMTACDLTSTLYSSFYIFLGPRSYSKY